MKRKALGVAMALMMPLSASQAESQGVEVQVQGQGGSRDAAIENALERALPQALGTAYFSVTSESGDSIDSVATSVSRGTVVDYEILSESEVFDGYQVSVEATISGEAMREQAAVEVTSWEDQLNQAHKTDRAQEQLREQSRVLERYLGSPGEMLDRGYALVLRSYVIDDVSGNQVSGRAFVDVHVNQSWWQSFYDLAEAITPVNDGETVAVGPFSDTNGVSDQDAAHIDQTLSESVQTPIPVTVEVPGLGHNTFFLSANTISVGGYMVYGHDGFNADDVLSRAYVKGDPQSRTPQELINQKRSDLQWVSRDGDVAGGNRFTVVVDFEKGSEEKVIEAMSKGLEYYVDYQSIN